MVSPSALLVGVFGVLPAPTVDFSFANVSTDGAVLSSSEAFAYFPLATGIVTGVSAVDYDNDGYADIFLPTGAGAANHFYRNLGNGQFTDIAATAGLATTAATRGALWFDYDGDGDLDLLLTHDSGASVLTLYRQNGPLSFTDVTAAAQLFLDAGPAINGLPQRQSGGVCAADINNDGYLDLCHGMWNGSVRLFMNGGDGTFTNISTSSGVGALLRLYWQPFMYDIDGDGWTDILLMVDANPNMLWINQRDSTFVNVAPSVGFANDMNDMGITIGDYDNDGDFDFYITNIYGTDAHSEDPEYNVLMRNDSTLSALSFTDVSIATGVDYGGWGWGTTFFDVNRDGWVDIGENNGYLGWYFPSQLFLNPGGAPFVFEEVGAAAGLNDAVLRGAALVALDYDRDGDQDLLQVFLDGYLRLLRTDLTGASAARHYLTVRPRMLGPNRYAVGATLHVTAGGLTQMRYISAGTSCLGQEPYEAFFGLGASSVVDTLRIDWPDGNVSLLNDVAADRMLTLTFGGTPGDLDFDGDVDVADARPFVDCLTGPGNGVTIYADGCAAGDLDDDGDVDLGDYEVLLRLVGD